MPRKIDETRLFEVAAGLFARHGYTSTKTKEIAAAAGVNEATLYRRYGSKAALLGRALDHQWRDVPLTRVRPTEDLEADLHAIVEAYRETNRLRGAILPALLVELARSGDLRAALGTALANVGRLVAIIEHHQAAGRLRAEAPMAMLNALIGPLLVQEMFQRAGLEGGDAPSTFDTSAHVRAFLDGRRARVD